VCAQVKLCIAREGVCVGAGGQGGPAGKSGPPDKSRSTTISSPLGH
jgi:hypothetical protein